MVGDEGGEEPRLSLDRGRAALSGVSFDERGRFVLVVTGVCGREDCARQYPTSPPAHPELLTFGGAPGDLGAASPFAAVPASNCPTVMSEKSEKILSSPATSCIGSRPCASLRVGEPARGSRAEGIAGENGEGEAIVVCLSRDGVGPTGVLCGNLVDVPGAAERFFFWSVFPALGVIAGESEAI